MTPMACGSRLSALCLLLLLAQPGRAKADDFWARAAERDHGASRRVVLSATRMLEGRGDDADAHRVRLALIEDPRAPALSDHALVSSSLVALELGVLPGLERRARLEQVAWALAIAPWTAAAARALGTVEWLQGNQAAARRHWQRALMLSFAPGERAEVFVRLGFASRSLGAHADAARHFSRALALAEDSSVARRDVEAALVGLALLALDAGDADAAARLAARSHAVGSARSNVSGVGLAEAFGLGREGSAAVERVKALARERSPATDGAADGAVPQPGD